MEQQAFHELLLTLKNCKDQQQRLDAEATYFNFRSMNPSDAFTEVILNEVITLSDVQSYAQVLLRQDFEKLENQCCFNRLSNFEQGKKLIITLMQYAATSPSHFMVAIIAQYTKNQLKEQHPFPEVYDFIVQGSQSENNLVRETVANLVAELTDSMSSKHFTFDILPFLQQQLADSCDSVATHASKALQNIIEYETNTAEVELPGEVTKQIVLAILQRVAQTLTNGAYELATKQLSALCEIIDVCGSDLMDQLPQIITLLEQIVLNPEVTEPAKVKAIFVFQTIVASCENLRKTLLDLVIGFIRKCVIPNAAMNELSLKQWLETDEDYEYEDCSLQAQSEDCVETISEVLGKQVILPLMKEGFNLAQSGDWKTAIATINALKFAAVGIQDVCKQADVDYCTRELLKFLTHENPRVRYDAVDCLAIIADDFKPRIQTMHKQIIPVLCGMVNDSNVKVQNHLPYAVMNYLTHMNYDNVYSYHLQLFEFTSLYFGGDMKRQTGAMLLLAKLSDIFDREDITPLIIAQMPGVFASFDQIMGAMRSVNEFNKTQTEYVTALMDCIQSAAEATPDMFKDHIEQILESFVFIAIRAEQQKEFELFTEVMKCMQSLIQNFKEQTQRFITPLYPLFVKVLNTDAMQFSSKPEEEADAIFDPNQQYMQTQVLITLTDFMETFPEVFGQYINELFELLQDLRPTDLDQSVSRLECLAELLHVADRCELDFNGLQALVNPIVFNTIFPQSDIDQQIKEEYDLHQHSDMADCLQIYLNAYLRYLIRTKDSSIYNELTPQIFGALAYIYEQSKACLGRRFQEIEDCDDLDADEQRAEMEQLFDDYDVCIDSIGAAYSEFIINFKKEIPQEIVTEIVKAADKLMSNGVESDVGLSQTIQGIALYADFAEFSSKEIVDQVYPAIYPKLLDMINSKKEEWQLIQIIFFALQSYLKKSENVEAAQNQDLLMVAAELLEAARVDGTEDSQHFYDNCCSYLNISGKLTQQRGDFWNTMINYCILMESDQEEVANCLLFFTELMENPTFQQELVPLYPGLADLFVRLLFGQYYSVIKNEASNATMIGKIREFLMRPELKNAVEASVRKGSDFVRKNFGNFFG
ncbi:Importin_beta-3 subunit [Hexamita inflata]|uniref:Importin beta-3 subunit n=1 Tax=Hexamita inflata TaxID=28002 RepID=A0AA86R6C5_9EUKA|nr:Importin beta-3 subunit [Hexamita inflata]